MPKQGQRFIGHEMQSISGEPEHSKLLIFGGSVDNTLVGHGVFKVIKSASSSSSSSSFEPGIQRIDQPNLKLIQEEINALLALGNSSTGTGTGKVKKKRTM